MNTTHFGYARVAEGDKAARVGAVFSSVAPRYDLMNDLMSFGLHRLWKRFCILAARIRPGDRVLDLAGGTGDLARLALRRGAGEVVVADVNPAMLGAGRDRLLDRCPGGRLRFAVADAEKLPFAAGSFDCVTMGFGLRNVTRPERALGAIRECLRPGGRLVVLEFSEVTVPALRGLYDRYSFSVLPRLGGFVTGDAPAYRYLVESIRLHPDQETLRGMMRSAGFRQCGYFNLSAGVVAVHRGYR